MGEGFEVFRALELEKREIYARYKHNKHFALVVNTKRAVRLQKQLPKVQRNDALENPREVSFVSP